MSDIITDYYKLYHKSFVGRISFFSDLHFSYNLTEEAMEKFLKHEEYVDPDYIVITGDLIDSLDMLEDITERRIFYLFLRRLSMIAPTYMSLGNHDFYGKGNYTIKQYKKDLLECSNICVLDNKNISLSDMNITGLSMKEKACNEKNAYKTRLMAYRNILKVEQNKLNILLTHSPKFNLDPDVYELISGFDLILSGHLHNGIVPGYLSFIPGSTGLVGPFHEIFPANSRNTYKKSNYKVITTGAIRTFHTMSGFEVLNKFYPMQDVVMDIDDNLKVYKKVYYEK